MFFNSAQQVGGDTGIEAVVGALDDVDIPTG
jgi:hypothetical protein